MSWYSASGCAELPSTPSRTVPMQFGARLLSGVICDAAIGSSHDAMLGGLVAGVVGAVVGTFGGHVFRFRLASAFKKDLPAALVEDALPSAARVTDRPGTIVNRDGPDKSK